MTRKAVKVLMRKNIAVAVNRKEGVEDDGDNESVSSLLHVFKLGRTCRTWKG